MKTLMTAGRILFALPFLVMGINHFIMIDVFTGMLASFIPGGGYTVLLTGAFLIFAAVCLIINKWVPVMCYLLAGLLFLFILTIHIPGVLHPGHHPGTPGGGPPDEPAEGPGVDGRSTGHRGLFFPGRNQGDIETNQTLTHGTHETVIGIFRNPAPLDRNAAWSVCPGLRHQ